MRKYDKKNKRNIVIIIAISALIVIMFSLVIKLFLSIDKKDYSVPIDNIVFNKDKELIKLNSEGTIKQKWNKEYYLTYNDENIELGNTAMAYDPNGNSLHLYGTYYEINSGEEINITSGETVIKSTSLTKFYKLADRKYLVVDKEIKTSDGLLSTNDFLMIDLDKVGNATLTNYKVNLKAFSETTIITSNYTFDIANEILTYGSDKIDLKKIIGSSNNYTKEDLIPEENNKSGGTGTADNESENTSKKDDKASKNDSDDKNNNKNSEEKVLIEEAKRKSRRTSVVSINSTINKIIVDYVIYDPFKEYTSVYMEVHRTGTNNIDTIYLKKDNTTHEITKNIIPGEQYEINFYSTYLNEGKEEKEKFDTKYITIKKPDINISVSRITKNQINYSISKEYDCDFTAAKLTAINITTNEIIYSGTININGVMPSGSIPLDNIELNKNDNIKLTLTNIKVNDHIVDGLEASTKIIY